MDDLEKKLLLQLDDEMPGVRTNALEALREHLKKQGRTFRDLVADLENAMSAAKVEELEQKLAEYVKANAAAQKRDADQRTRNQNAQSRAEGGAVGQGQLEDARGGGGSDARRRRRLVGL